MTAMDDNTKMLYDLVRYSGIEMDPTLFQNIKDLLESGKIQCCPGF